MYKWGVRHRESGNAKKSPDTLSHTRQQPLQRLCSELVSAESEVSDDTPASPGVHTSASKLVGSGIVWQSVQLELRLKSHLLRKRRVSRNKLQCSSCHFVLLKHLSLEVVSHHPRVDKRRWETHRLWESLHRLASCSQTLCNILHRRHLGYCVYVCVCSV